MEPMREDHIPAINQQLSRDWMRLIRKLRSIGLDPEARRLEQALRTLPAAKRSAVCDGQPEPTRRSTG